MKKVIRLTESELESIIKEIINEASPLATPGTPPPAAAAPTFSMPKPDINFPDIPEKKTPPPPPPPKTIFGVGDRDPKIAAFQKNLIALGYNVGKNGADGIFGPATQAAVKDFQQKYGIKVSGRVGPPTMRKLGEVVTAKGQAKYDPNAEWNKDRAYGDEPQPTQSTQAPKAPPTRLPSTGKAGGGGVLTRKLREKPATGFKTSDYGGKRFSDWVAKNRLY